MNTSSVISSVTSPVSSSVLLPTDRLPRLVLCDRIQCETGFVHPDRIMDLHVLLYVEQGSFHLYEEEPGREETRQEYYLTEGSLLFLKEGMHHYGAEKCPDGTKWFFVHFLLPEDTSEGYILPKQMHVPAGSSIVSGFSQLLDCYCSTDSADTLRVHVLLYQILLDLYCEAGKRRIRDSKEIRTEEMKNYLETQKREPFSSNKMEETMGLSFKHLNVIFKSVTGTTLQHYHAQLRLEAAARMLRETNKSVDEIGQYFGFEDPGYFCNSFKKQFGISPSKYRKEQILI